MHHLRQTSDNHTTPCTASQDQSVLPKGLSRHVTAVIVLGREMGKLSAFTGLPRDVLFFRDLWRVPAPAILGLRPIAFDQHVLASNCLRVLVSPKLNFGTVGRNNSR